MVARHAGRRERKIYRRPSSPRAPLPLVLLLLASSVHRQDFARLSLFICLSIFLCCLLHLSLSLYISLSLSLYISRFYVIYSYIYVHTTFYSYLPLPSLPVVLFISSLSPDLSLSFSLSLISSSLRLSSCPQGSLSRFRSPLPSSIFPLR